MSNGWDTFRAFLAQIEAELEDIEVDPKNEEKYDKDHLKALKRVQKYRKDTGYVKPKKGGG